MSLQIPKDIKKEFQHGFNDYIKSMGRKISAHMDPTSVSCPNCLFDTIQKKSANIYNETFVRPVNIFPGTSIQKTIFPAPFNVTSVSGVQYDPTLIDPKILTGALCPVCKGEGILQHENNTCFIGVITIGKSGAPGFEDLSAGREGVQFARIKTYANNYSVCRDAKFFIMDGKKYKIEIPASIKGLGGLDITELFLSEIEEGPSVNINYDKDIRVLNTEQGPVSNQATSGSPIIPPIVPGDDVW